ncbi:ABC transporter permease subunit [Ornithinimicrobium panacihumi]|uniref:ABC transporter permease subunit n=1 Tax=Ornithinimicrobium panacihumi TaxID=2008449 RepID=UPI003F89B424
MRLIKVELARLTARRLLILGILAALAIGAVTVAGVFTQARQIDQARAGLDEQYQQMVDGFDEQIEQCKLDERYESERSGHEVDFGCEQMQLPTIEEFYGQMPSLFDQFTQLFGVLAYPLMFVALAIGSTAVAAEFAHRTMGSWLTFEPRRTPVYLSKLIAPALAAIPVGLVGLLTVFVGVPAVFRWFNIDEGLSADQWSDLLWMLARILGLVVAAGAFGAAAAFVLKHSGLVIGLMVGYLVLVEGMLSMVFGFLTRYSLGRNLSAVIHDGTRWETWPQSCGGPGMVECVPVVHTLTLTHGVLVLTVLLLAVAVLGWVRFTRSDID